jgi:hypothetical protein
MKTLKGSFRQVAEGLADELHPGNTLFAKLMSNMADSAEKIAFDILTNSDNASKPRQNGPS